jgi:hypothetical protein
MYSCTRMRSSSRERQRSCRGVGSSAQLSSAQLSSAHTRCLSPARDTCTGADMPRKIGGSSEQQAASRAARSGAAESDAGRQRVATAQQQQQVRAPGAFEFIGGGDDEQQRRRAAPVKAPQQQGARDAERSTAKAAGGRTSTLPNVVRFAAPAAGKAAASRKLKSPPLSEQMAALLSRNLDPAALAKALTAAARRSASAYTLEQQQQDEGDGSAASASSHSASSQRERQLRRSPRLSDPVRTPSPHSKQQGQSDESSADSGGTPPTRNELDVALAKRLFKTRAEREAYVAPFNSKELMARSNNANQSRLAFILHYLLAQLHITHKHHNTRIQAANLLTAALQEACSGEDPVKERASGWMKIAQSYHYLPDEVALDSELDSAQHLIDIVLEPGSGRCGYRWKSVTNVHLLHALSELPQYTQWLDLTCYWRTSVERWDELIQHMLEKVPTGGTDRAMEQWLGSLEHCGRAASKPFKNVKRKGAAECDSDDEDAVAMAIAESTRAPTKTPTKKPLPLDARERKLKEFGRGAGDKKAAAGPGAKAAPRARPHSPNSPLQVAQREQGSDSRAFCVFHHHGEGSDIRQSHCSCVHTAPRQQTLMLCCCVALFSAGLWPAAEDRSDACRAAPPAHRAGRGELAGRRRAASAGGRARGGGEKRGRIQN